MTIGQRIKARRQELDMSVDKLAAMLGKNRATVYRYENGNIENMPLDVLEPIASALKTTPAYLMGWDQEEIEEISKEQDESLAGLSVLIEDQELFIHNMHLWNSEVGEMHFSPEELKQMMNYAKLLIAARKDQ